MAAAAEQGLETRATLLLDALGAELHAAMVPLLLQDEPAAGGALLITRLAAHFHDLAFGADAAAAAHRRLRLSPPEAPPFDVHLAAAFDGLAAAASAGPGDRCVPPQDFEVLVALLTGGMPPQLAVQVQRLLSDVAGLAPDYATFAAAVRACLVLEQLAAPEPCEGRTLAVAEARELLMELLARQEWLSAIEMPPLQSVGELRPVAGAGSRGGGLDLALEAEARMAAADKLLAAAGVQVQQRASVAGGGESPRPARQRS